MNRGDDMKRQINYRLQRLHCDERGQMLAIGLFFIGIIAGLLFMIYNTGDKINTKVETQNTADAVAATAASWYARGLNTISMCNVTQTQLLSVIVLLDSLETVAPVSQRIIDDLVSNLGNSAHGTDTPNHPQLSEWLIVGNAREEQQVLRQINRMVSRIPIAEYCQYDSGILWQTCYLLNEMATQVALLTPELIQREAIKVAQDNNASVGFALPYVPTLPIQRIDNSGASFRNFRRPMVSARTPDGRQILGYQRLQHYNNRRWGHYRSRSRMGPFAYMRQPFVEPTPMGLFELSRFSSLMQRISDQKLNMLFGGPDELACLQPMDRIENYDDLLKYVQEFGRNSVVRTYWSYLNFDSRYEYDTPDFFANLQLRHQKYPREQLRAFNGFRAAPNGFTRATTVSQGADPRHDLWFRSLERRRALYPQLGIAAPHPPYRADGSRWPYTQEERTPYFRNSLWRFNGADVGEEEPLHRRYLPPRGRPPRLAPILLDRHTGLNRGDNVDKYFTLVGFAYKPQKSSIMPGFFANSVPNDQLVCYAQTIITNPTSWDLFTQNWRFELVMTTHWDRAIDWSQAALPNIQGESLDSEDVQPVIDMLRTYPAEVVHEYLTH